MDIAEWRLLEDEKELVEIALEGNTVALIMSLRDRGRSYYSIASVLNAEGVGGGRKWYPSTVKAVCSKLYAR